MRDPETFRQQGGHSTATGWSAVRLLGVQRSTALIARRGRSVAALAGAVLLLAACGGGGSEDGAAGAGAEATEPTASTADGETGGDAASNEAVPARTGAGLLDLGGPEVEASSDTEVNLLPDVVVDDLTNDRKVNFRNLVPQDKPILLWMYAPH